MHNGYFLLVWSLDIKTTLCSVVNIEQIELDYSIDICWNKLKSILQNPKLKVIVHLCPGIGFYINKLMKDNKFRMLYKRQFCGIFRQQ